MLYENINSLNAGMIVGKDIIDSDTNRVLLKTGATLTDFYIKHLKDKGYKGIYVENENYKKVVVEDLIPEELKNSSINALKNLDVEATIDNAKKIVDELISKKNITFESYSLKDDEYEHCIKVAEMSIVIGRALNLKENELVDLAVAALLHDFGKCIKDPENQKKLNYEGQIGSYKEELYPLYGYELLKNYSSIKATTKVGVLTHNMNEDGSNNIFNKKIPQHRYGQIIHVADTYDRIVSKKYNNKLTSPSEATELLLGGCGTNFNREVVEAFIKYIPIYPKGTKIVLSNGITGVVYENNLDNPLRPKVILENGELIDLLDFNFNNVTIANDYETAIKEKDAEIININEYTNNGSNDINEYDEEIKKRAM